MALNKDEQTYPFKLLTGAYHRREPDGIHRYKAGDTIHLTESEAKIKLKGRVQALSGESLKVLQSEAQSQLKVSKAAITETDSGDVDAGQASQQKQKTAVTADTFEYLKGLGWKDTVTKIQELKTPEEVAAAIMWEEQQLPQARKSVIDAANKHLEELLAKA
jgi:hypothetical protein